jgi:hypothetical protein
VVNTDRKGQQSQLEYTRSRHHRSPERPSTHHRPGSFGPRDCQFQLEYDRRHPGNQRYTNIQSSFFGEFEQRLMMS